MRTIGLPGHVTRGAALASRLSRSPELNAHVERNDGTWRCEFYAAWDLPDDDLDDVNRWIDAFADEFDTFRPRQALDGRTPAISQRQGDPTPVSYVANQDRRLRPVRPAATLGPTTAQAEP